MRILHLLNDIHQLGNGIINAAVDLACLQAKAGHDVTIASDRGEYESLLATYGVNHLPLDPPRRMTQLWPAIQRYRHILQTVQPDIVHAHMMTGLLLAKLGQVTTSYALVATVHNEFQRNAILMGLADRVIAVSQAVSTSLQQRGIPAQKICLVRNGTLGAPRLQQPQTTAPLHHPAITTIAGMRDRKGIAELIQAFTQVAAKQPEAHLYLVGNGPDLAQYQQQAQSSPYRDRIHFEGFQPDPMAYLQATDIFVLASKREPFGLVLAEARTAGCAIVASNVDGIPEVLDQGQAGILVPPADATAIADTLATLLTHPEQLRHWQHRAQQNLDWLSVTRMTDETLAVYRQLQAPPSVLPVLAHQRQHNRNRHLLTQPEPEAHRSP
jgi:glycosyltransferase involved in cell wall biosynthesis